ncbi:hypothetical protein [Helicobacter typhlonius]|uniref:Uncharacterized protein n=1 Tax=Helicobacter typhlonius TaxID=76936 RepID=A0A0S4PVU4_9HELI|nr:hypothetical protein [Helicobacter typhlonius]CUU40447.1 Hypothetical protein BN2458_PEG1564 [Helicobacter typhlonius]
MSLLHRLNALPALTSVCDRKFFYIIFANAFIYAFLSWQLNGGGGHMTYRKAFLLSV